MITPAFKAALEKVIHDHYLETATNIDDFIMAERINEVINQSETQKSNDVTELMAYEQIDDELLYVSKCACDATKDFIINVYADDPNACPACGRKFYFTNTVRIYEAK